MRRAVVPTSPRAGVVIPVRAFALGKARLATDLAPAARAELACRWATRVLDAAGTLPVVIVTSAPEVRQWARRHMAGGRNVAVVDDPGSLDTSAAAGLDHLALRGCERVVVAHGDLPRARSLDAVVRDGARPVVTLVPCHRDDGTNVLSIPITSAGGGGTGAGFRFSYGPGSFRRHTAEAHRLGMGVRVVRDPDLAFDVDVPADLEALGAVAIA